MPWQIRGIPLSRLECLVCEWKKDYVLVSSRKNFLLSIFFVFSSYPNIPLFQHVHVHGGMLDNNCWPEFCAVHRSDQSNPLFENNFDRHLPALDMVNKMGYDEYSSQISGVHRAVSMLQIGKEKNKSNKL